MGSYALMGEDAGVVVYKNKGSLHHLCLLTLVHQATYGHKLSSVSSVHLPTSADTGYTDLVALKT